MSNKRTLDAFFAPAAKRPRNDSHEQEQHDTAVEKSHHPQYPFSISGLPEALRRELPSLPSREPKTISDQPDLDLLYFHNYFPKHLTDRLFDFLRSELPFYRVEYDIKRAGVETHVRTPRWTTVFGLDETSRFDETGCVVDAETGSKVSDKLYNKCPPRPLPQCLRDLLQSTEAATACKFNFCLVNYYASGADSIAFHSDDERFLGSDPAIASFSLGARRDFLMKHKPAPPGSTGAVAADAKLVKLPLNSGDMVLMRGATQANWLHSIPKRTGKNQEDGGRINITFRRAMVKGGTENYYNYNVGSGPVYRWNKKDREMALWQPKGEGV